MRVRLKDIAEKVGVSISTVSRALSDSKMISESTKKMIVKVARDMGYFPDPHARGLKKVRTRVVGILIPELDNLFFAEAVSGMERALFSAEHQIILCSTRGDPKKEVQSIRVLMSHNVDGVLAAPVDYKANKKYYNMLLSSGIHLVFFDRFVSSVDAAHVISDNEGGISTLVEYLIRMGHRRIGYIGLNLRIYTAKERLKAFMKFVKNGKIESKDEWITHGKYAMEDAERAVEKILSLKDRPTALVFANNVATLGGLKVFRRYGIKIPDEISIVSFDDAHWNLVFDPPVTCVAQNPTQMGLFAATILLDSFTSNEKPGVDKSVVIKTKFIERDSVKRIGGV